MGRFAAPTDDLLADEERTAYKLENERTELLAKDALFAEELERTKSALARSREALMAHDETGRNCAAAFSTLHKQRRMRKVQWRKPKHVNTS